MINTSRLPFLFLAIVCLLLGLYTGLNRIGWTFYTLSVSLHHGAIMVGGFLGTLIALEKIIPLKKRALFLIPAMSGASVLMFLLKLPTASFILLTTASAFLSGVFLLYWIRERSATYLLMLLGALCWMVGNALLISATFYPRAFPWWLAFTLCIITAERIELMKFLPVSRTAKWLPVVFISVCIMGILMSFHGIGRQLSGAALIAVALWLMHYDLISISIGKKGLPRFVATALLCGYIAMLLTGIFILALGSQAMAYDVVVHTYFLGFVFSMIFAHGPIILPGVLGISAKPWSRILYCWLAILHLSWILRITGDIFLHFDLRRASSILTVLSILCYFATIAILTINSQRRHGKVY